jgi:hypothetical protein
VRSQQQQSSASALYPDQTATSSFSRLLSHFCPVLCPCVQRIALTGRTVLCTIHQPAARLFYLFDRLLLLEPGGRTIYFHSIGRRGEELVSYLEAASNFEVQLPSGMNPADFALGLRSDLSKGNAANWAYKWSHSRLNEKQVLPLLAKYVSAESFTEEQRKTATCAPVGVVFASWWQRYHVVQKRLFISYWSHTMTCASVFTYSIHRLSTGTHPSRLCRFLLLCWVFSGATAQ